MNDKKRLKLLKIESKYYDIQRKELKAIEKQVDLSDKDILDVGAGIGRLSFPLCQTAKSVVALDTDKALIKHYKEKKKDNLIFINESIQDYANRTSRKFDIIIAAWCSNEFLKHLKKLSHKKTIIIILSQAPNSEYDKIIRNFVPPPNPKKESREASVKLWKKINININLNFPNKKEAKNVILSDLILWWGKKLTEEELKILDEKLEKFITHRKITLTENTKIKFIKLR